MLRPATPLTVLLLAAFALLLISVLSTPIVKQIPLASFEGVDFGVLGFCQGTKCSNIEIGYDTASLFTDTQSATFDLPSSTRTTLSAILIVHPIAALFTLIMLILSAIAHFHSPSHSPRYLLGIFILSILTLIVSLLAFLIDVLLFVPHMAWGSYIVLAATILIAASGIVSCAMRRTLVSRKARKRRIAENAEMNGENFYARQGPEPIPLMTTASNTLVNGGTGVDKLPTFATFESIKKDPDERSSDERVPLTARTPTESSPANGPGTGPGMPERYGSQSRDQYGNVMPRPPPGSYGMRSREGSVEPSMNRQYSDGSVNGRGRGGMPQGVFRGRGGYPPSGRGGYGPPRGGYGSRGGYGPPPRGGYGGPYRGGMNDSMMAGAAGGMAAGQMMRGGRQPPPSYGPPNSGYDNRGMSPASYGRQPQQSGYVDGAYAAVPPPAQYTPYNPDESTRDSLPRAESPPPLSGLEHEGPVGQAVEMDATTGSPSRTPAGFGQFGGLRESDGDVAGMVGLQQQLQRQTVDSESSRYSDQPYVPPRQQWTEGGRSGSPLNPSSQPAELPSPTVESHKRVSSAGDNYYEDVDPRFAEPPPAAIPAALAPGYPQNTNSNLRPIQPMGLDGSSSYEDLQSGARSPAESDRSNFTSVSQRGVNPRWNGGGGYGAPMPRRPVPQQQQQTDMLLNSNPDFMLPGGRGGRGFSRGGARGPSPNRIVPNSAYPGPSGGL